jgi:catechol-2,3-dioxygenase
VSPSRRAEKVSQYITKIAGVGTRSKARERAMERFVHGQNLIRFSQQLAAERDPNTQATLMRLLVDEENSLGAGLEHLEIDDCH